MAYKALHGLQITPSDFVGFIVNSFLPCSLYSSHISFIPSVSIYQMPSCSRHCFRYWSYSTEQSPCLIELIFAFCSNIYQSTFFVLAVSFSWNTHFLYDLILPLQICSNAILLKRPDHPTQDSNLHSPPLSLECKLLEDKDLVCPGHFDVLSGWLNLICGR